MSDQYSAEEFALAREFDAIRRGYGKPGVVKHYLAAHKLIWPEDDQHRWFVLGMTRICENKVICFLGAASSNKTYIFTVHALINFWAFPHTSLAILSTTDIISLERKVWGRLKKMFNRGRERYPWLDGFVLDSKRQITPDDIDDENEVARTLDHGIGTVACVSNGRFVGMGKFQGSKPPNTPGKMDGIMVHYGDECFPAGTLVDTPNGKIPIESISAGDAVCSAIGISTVVSTMRRTARRLCRIKTKDGRIILCTEKHPFLTQFGWKRAIDLNQSCVMITQHEANQIIAGNKVQTLWKSQPQIKQDFLQSVLQSEVVVSTAGISKEPLYARTLCKNSEIAESVIQESPRALRSNAVKNGSRLPELLRFSNSGAKKETQYSYQHKVEAGRTQTPNSWWEWNRPNKSGVSFAGIFSRFGKQFSCENQNEGWKRIPNPLQSRCCFSEQKTSCGIGRSLTQCDCPAGTGCEESELSHSSWVDSVEVSKPSSFTNASDCDRGIEVYNLEIAGHPSYSVNGFLVHNCAVMETSFLDAYANWMVNDGFKGVMGGNPTDISDPLCTAAEPRGGWDSFIDTGKTQEWTSRWYDAHVVAFDGRDTPNNDEPKNRYPYLITQKFIDLMASTHGLDSWQYFQQAIGKPSRGMVSNRVITIGLCEKHHAFESAAWKGTARTKLFSCDPAFGGGDRCVGGECEFGEDKDGNIIFAVGTPEIIPIRLNCGIEPEDQIAEFIFNQHKRLNIPPENFFYDSFGRGTLGNSFAKKFGSTCPIPVDSGAPTTERPVRFDLFIDEKNGERRLKTCKEHYSKFVTEMWFSTREAIESNQVRNLSMPVAQEGQLRLFRIVAGNKVEVESKDDMKERVKKSPDLYDYFAIALEGARRLGFRIERIGREVQSSKPDEDYFDNEVREWDAAINAGLLKH